jgi:hypothetical protein
MKLAIFPAWIDTHWKISQKSAVKGTAGEAWVELSRVHADQHGLKAKVDETFCKGARVLFP